MKLRQSLGMVVVAGAVVLSAAGCTVSAHVGTTHGSTAGAGASAGVHSTGSAKPGDVATQMEDSLEQQVGTRPSIDCGAADIPVVKDSVVHCDLTDPSSSNHYDVTATFTSVVGTKYHIDIQVADTPKA